MAALDASEWRSLELLEKGVVRLDIRGLQDRLKLPVFIKLYEQGFATLQETGPGDSIHLFKLSAAGKEALDAHRLNPI